MATTRLYTEGNKWQYSALRENDPHFSSFLLDMQEAVGMLEDEIQLTGSVAQIIEQEWSAYLQLYDLHKRFTPTPDNILELEGIIPLYGPRSVASNNQPPHYYFRDVNEAFALPIASSVVRILLIVDHLPNAHLLLRVGETASQENRVGHLALMGKTMYDMGIRLDNKYVASDYHYMYRSSMSNLLLGEPRGDAAPTYSSTMEWVDRLVYDHARCSMKNATSSILRCVSIVALAILHNVRISRKDYGLYDIFWDDVKPLVDYVLQSEGETTIGPYEYSILNLADILLGKSQHLTCMLTMRLIDVNLTKDRVGCSSVIPYVRMKDVGKLYRNLLRAVEDNSRVDKLGLCGIMWNFNAVTNGRQENPYYIVGMIHETIICHFMHNLPRISAEHRYRTMTYLDDRDLEEELHPELTELDMNYLVRYLACTFIGKEGLHRISQFIHSYLDNSKYSTTLCVECGYVNCACNRDTASYEKFTLFVRLIDEFLANPTNEWEPHSGGLYDLNEIRALLCRKMR